eukprot:c2596_g1_i2.p1 GENE.c2596_g1_i2~~c2596_g1_i2.p1  ORF type:complete len:117 (-),score=18.99 c2596_g1_i2:40-390(-)
MTRRQQQERNVREHSSRTTTLSHPKTAEKSDVLKPDDSHCFRCLVKCGMLEKRKKKICKLCLQAFCEQCASLKISVNEIPGSEKSTHPDRPIRTCDSCRYVWVRTLIETHQNHSFL